MNILMNILIIITCVLLSLVALVALGIGTILAVRNLRDQGRLRKRRSGSGRFYL